MMYWPSYLWTNFWLVLYTWLQHTDSNLPCYHAQEATAALKAYLEPRGLYNFDGQPWPLAAWNVGKKCHYMGDIKGVCFWRCLATDRKERAAERAAKKE